MSTTAAASVSAVTPAGAALGDELVRLVKTLERTGAQVAARRRDDLDKAAYAVLFRLLHDGPQRSGALAEVMLTDPSTVSRHVAHLVSRGLVERQADPADGRATVLGVTGAGHRLADQLHERRNTTIATVVAGWDEDEVGRLTDLLARFSADLELQRPHILAACDTLAAAQTSTAQSSTTEGAS